MIAKKSYIHTLKPQIQSVEPRKGILGTKAIPCVLSLDPYSSMLVYMLFVLIYMFYALCHAFHA